jgi:hypothetical protein
MIENWIDLVCKAFGTLGTDGNGQLTSYRTFEKGEIPSALSVYPCAITYVPELEPNYSAGAISSLLWSGTTEIHVTPTVDPALLPGVEKFYTRVLQMMTANRSLGGKVQYFMLPEGSKAVHMTVLQYGQGPAHYGLIVTWEVLENVSLPLSG